MKRLFLLTILVLLISGCERTQKNPLVGRWQSHEEATLFEARGSGSLTEEQLQQLRKKKVFGKMIATIDSEKIVFNYKGKLDHSPYRILKIEKPFIDIELLNSSTNAYEKIQIEIHGDRIWVPSAIVDFREVFDRID